MTRLTFSCSRSTLRSLHIFRKWENEEWSRRIYTLTCRWLQASKRSVKISVSVKESITRAIIWNEFEKNPLGCYHSIPRELVHEKFDFQYSLCLFLRWLRIMVQSSVIQSILPHPEIELDPFLPRVRQIWSLLKQECFSFLRTDIFSS